MAFRGLGADGLSQPKPRECPDQHRSQQNGDHQGHTGSNKYRFHRAIQVFRPQIDRSQHNIETQAPTAPVSRSIFRSPTHSAPAPVPELSNTYKSSGRLACRDVGTPNTQALRRRISSRIVLAPPVDAGRGLPYCGHVPPLCVQAPVRAGDDDASRHHTPFPRTRYRFGRPLGRAIFVRRSAELRLLAGGIRPDRIWRVTRSCQYYFTATLFRPNQ